MSLHYCRQCTTAYAAELRHCPHCGSIEYCYSLEDAMPKIAREAGPSNAADLPGEPMDLTRKGSAVRAQEAHDREAAASAQSAEPSQGEGRDLPAAPENEFAVDDYDTRSYADLQAACRERSLSATGTRHDLIKRLRTFDQKSTENG